MDFLKYIRARNFKYILCSWVTLFAVSGMAGEGVDSAQSSCYPCAVSAGDGSAPLFGVDTAGVFLLRNASTADVGWTFKGFRDGLGALNVDFIIDHYLEPHTGSNLEENLNVTLERFKALSAFQNATGIEHVWNLERANWMVREEFFPGVNLFEPKPGLHRFHMPEVLMHTYANHPLRRFVVFDELEHMQMNNNRFKLSGARGDKPAIYDTTKLDLPEAYEGILGELSQMREDYALAGLTPVVETVWPSMHHIFARAGWVISPKILKESWTPVPVAMAMGAAIQYQDSGTDLWLNPDLWFCGHYPGHSIDALRSALIFGHWLGVSRMYVENLDHVNVRGVIHQPDKALGFDYASAEQGRHHPDAKGVYGSLLRYPTPETFVLTGHGEAVNWYGSEYRVQNPNTGIHWSDARCDFAIVRFPDSVWGQRDSFFEDAPLGSRAVQSTPEMEAWFDIWHLLSHGEIPTTTLSFHGRSVKYIEPPRFFVPSSPTLVFDHRIGDEHPDFDFRGAKVVFVTGIEVTDATLKLLQDYAAEGNTVVSLPHLAPEKLRDAWTAHEGESGTLAHAIGAGSWMVTDSFLTEPVQQVVRKYQSSKDEMRYRFGETEVTFEKIDGDRIRAFINGEAVSPVFSPSKRARWNDQRGLVPE